MTQTQDESAHTYTAYIGLGSNLERPDEQINSALNALAGISHSNNVRSSHWYSSKAIGPGEQPDYINAVAALETHLSPIALLHQLQRIENDHGRQRQIRWGARTLDLDLLLYGDTHIDSDELTLPHPEMMKRNFVLYPLYDVASTLVLPNGKTLHHVVAETSMTGLHRITKTTAAEQINTPYNTNKECT